MKQWYRLLNRKWIKFGIKLIVSLGLLFWILFHVDWGVAWEQLKDVKPIYVAFYLVLIVSGISISAYKWQMLTRYKGFRRSYREHFRMYLTGAFINNFLPSIIGGDTYRVLSLGTINDHRSPAFSTIIIDRLSGIWALCTLSLLFAFFELDVVWNQPLWLTLLILTFLFLLFELLTIRKNIYSFFLRWFTFIPEKIRRLAQEVESFRSDNLLVRAYGMGLVFDLVGVGLANFVLFRALGSDISIFAFFSVIFVISLIASLPVSINNIGLKEWAYLTFFGFLGVSPEISVTAAIIGRFLQMLVSFFALPEYLRSRRVL